MPELIFPIKLELDQASAKTVKSQLNDIQREVNQGAKGEASTRSKATNATKAQAKAERELYNEFKRQVTVNEVKFRQGELSQKQALEAAEAIERQAIEQGVLTESTLRGARAQKTMFLSQQRISTGFTGIAQSSATANQSLMNLGRIVQDLPFGFLGISNNIDPALNSFRALKEETGGVGGAFKALLGSLKGSGGLIFALGSLLPTAVLIAQKGWNMYAKKTKEATDETIKLRDESELLADAVKSQIGDFIDTFDKGERITALKEALNKFSTEGVPTLKVDFDALKQSMIDFEKSFGKDGARIVQRDSGEIVRETRREIMLAMDQREEVNELLEAELQNRLATLEADQRILDARIRLGLLGNFEQQEISPIEFDIPDVVDPDAEARQQAFLDSVSQRAQRQNEINRVSLETRLAASSQYEQKRIKLIQERISNTQALIESGVEKEKAREMSMLLFNIKMANHEEEVQRKLEQKKTEITRQEEEKRKQLRQQAIDSSFAIANNFISSLQQLNQAQTDETEEQARKRFETQKKLSKAQAVVNGAAAVVKTYQQYGFTPFGIGAAAAQIAAVAVQLRAIEQTQFNAASASSSGSDSSSSRQTGFFETDAQNQEPRRINRQQPVMISLEGEFDEEVVSIKAERGSEKRKKGAFFPIENG